MSGTVTNTFGADQEVPCTLQFVDAFGNVAITPAGVPVWAVSDATLATVVAAADGLSAVVAAAGKEGSVDVTVTLGALTGKLTLTVTAGAAVSLEIVAGTPVLKPVAPAA